MAAGKVRKEGGRVVLNGEDLKISDIGAVVDNIDVKVEIDPKKIKEIEGSRKFLEEEMSKRVIYGVNTGFGPMASHLINSTQVEKLQQNLVKGHAVGMGDPLGEKDVLSAMIVRLNTLIKGYSGVSLELIDHLKEFINNRIIPVVPEHGAVGTSGDLTQLSHIALALIGGGDVIYNGKRRQVSDVLKELNIEPYTLKSKEGLALINGTSAMTGVAALNCLKAKKALDTAIKTSAYALELARAHNDCLEDKLHSVRPHTGQREVAKKLRETLASSDMMRPRNSFDNVNSSKEDVEKISDVVQEVYSFRCVPQILGPVYDTVDSVCKEVEIEINSSSDNPVVDKGAKRFLHGGNFHGDYISFAMDRLKISMVKLTMLSERRINFFLNEKINNFFPPFLNLKSPGLTMGLQGLQFVATSTTSQSQTLSFPQYVHSIPTNGDNQDVVSMGMESALFCSKVIDNAYNVLSIELIALTQASDFIGSGSELSDSSKSLYKRLRSVFPKVVEDRVLVYELPKVKKILKDNKNEG